MEEEKEKELFEIEYCKQFSAVKIPLKEFQFVSDSQFDKSYIENLKRINLFVGENDSGKSWLVRELFKFVNFKEDNDTIWDSIYLNDLKTELLIELDSNYGNFSNDEDHDKIFKHFKETFISLFDKEQKFKLWEIRNRIIEFYNYIQDFDIEYTSIYYNDDYENKIFIGNNTKLTINKIFINNYRSLTRDILNGERLRNIFNDYYIIKSNYINFNHKIDSEIINGRIGIDYFIETGSNLYDDFQNKFSSTPEKRDDYFEYEDFLSKYFYNGIKVKIVPQKVNENGVVVDIFTIKVGKNTSKPIHHLGTGLQMMIALTWPLFQYDSGLIFIEEPELYLHPKFQYKLLDIYSNHYKAKNFQFYISTHSNHIIDMMSNEEKISIYTIEKKSVKLFHINNVNLGDSKPYELLGVKPSSLSIANCLIWVEGPSDMIYFKKWINLVDPTLVSGSHFEVAMYGGSLYQYLKVIDKKEITEEDYNDSINEFIQILRVNPNFLFIADSDLDSYNDCGYNIKYENIVNDLEKYFKSKPFIFTSGRTIENYITPDMIYSLTKVDSNIQPIDKYEVFFHKDTKVQSYYRKNLLPLPRESSDNLINNKVIFSKRISKAITVDHLKNSPSWVTPNTKETLYYEILNVVNKIRNWNHLEPLN